MLALSETHLQQLYELSRAFIYRIQNNISDLWKAHLKPHLGKRGEGYLSTAHQRLESLDRWQVVIATVLVTVLLVRLLMALKDNLQSFQEKGELSPHLCLLLCGNLLIIALFRDSHVGLLLTMSFRSLSVSFECLGELSTW